MKNIFVIFTFIFLLVINCEALEKLPDFCLEDINGKQVRSYEVLHKVPIIIDFWATWCGPCKQELPILNELQKKYQDSLKVICISVDKPRAINRAKAFIKSRRYSFLTLFDPDKDIIKLFNVNSIPQSYIITKDGGIVYHHTGYKKGDEIVLEEELKKLFKKEAQKAIASEEITSQFVEYDEEPIPIKKFIPEIPEKYIKKGIKERVILQVEVLKNGSVGKIKVLKSAEKDKEDLNTIAIETIKKWKFIPAKYKHEPVAVWITLPVIF